MRCLLIIGLVMSFCRPLFAVELRLLTDTSETWLAREIALDYLLGWIGQIPVIFNGWVYVVDYDSKCIITVTAKDDTTVHFTYRYSSCR